MKILFSSILILIAVSSTAQQSQTQSRPAEVRSTYRHTVGLEFRYPSDWIVREASFGEAELVPPDQQKNERGVTEGFFLCGIGGEFTGAADPTLSSYLNSVLMRMAPFLKQNGDPEVLESGEAPTITMSWSGTSDDGMNISAKALAATHGALAFALVMLGNQDRMVLRDAPMREIFSSFHFAEGPRDPALVGHWSSPPPAQTQPAAEAGLTMELEADGSFVFRDASGSGTGSEGDLRGHWYASDDRLCFVYPESFFLNFHYEIEGEPGARKLTLRHSSGGFQTLIEAGSPKK